MIQVKDFVVNAVMLFLKNYKTQDQNGDLFQKKEAQTQLEQDLQHHLPCTIEVLPQLLVQVTGTPQELSLIHI